MEILELRNDIRTRNLKPFYVFYGDEWKVQDLYIDQIVKMVGRKVSADAVSEILPLLNNRLLSTNRTVFVVHDDMDFIGNEKAQRRLLECIRDNVVILRVFKADKRAKFFRTYCGSSVEFKALERAVLARYLKAEINLSEKNIDWLIDNCQNNYGQCLSEIDKIRRFGDGSFVSIDGATYDANATMKYLIEQGAIYEPPYDAIFDFADSVILGCAPNVVFDLLKQCQEMGEATLALLSVLYTNVKQVLQVQACAGRKDVAEITGLTGWQIKKAKEKVGYRDTADLVYMLKLIRKIEKGIKTGQIEDGCAMEYLLVNVL